MGLFGNTNAVRTGTMAGSDFFWNRQWSVDYKTADITLTRIVKVKDADLSAFYINASCASGGMILKMKQGHVEKDIHLSRGFNARISMAGFTPGMLTITIFIRHATNVKVVVGWRR